MRILALQSGTSADGIDAALVSVTAGDDALELVVERWGTEPWLPEERALVMRAVDGSPSGAAARESPFLQSYRAQLAHFVAVLAGETPYEAPTDQLVVARVVEAIYRAADERKEVRL